MEGYLFIFASRAERSLRNRLTGRLGSGTVLDFAAMSDGSMTNTGPSCPNSSCVPLSHHSVDLLQRQHSRRL